MIRGISKTDGATRIKVWGKERRKVIISSLELIFFGLPCSHERLSFILKLVVMQL